MPETVEEENNDGGVGVFTEEEANRKRQKREQAVSLELLLMSLCRKLK